MSSRRDDRQVAVELPVFLESLARAIRSGLSVPSAMTAARSHVRGPLRADLDAVNARLDRGASLASALDDWRRRRADVHGVHTVASALTIASRAGGVVSDAVDGVAQTLRSQIDLEAEVRALAAQARASAILVASLPVVFGLVAAVADPRSIAVLSGSPLGAACALGGLTLDLAGWLWMRSIVRSATP